MLSLSTSWWSVLLHSNGSTFFPGDWGNKCNPQWMFNLELSLPLLILKSYYLKKTLLTEEHTKTIQLKSSTCMKQHWQFQTRCTKSYRKMYFQPVANKSWHIFCTYMQIQLCTHPTFPVWSDCWISVHVFCSSVWASKLKSSVLSWLEILTISLFFCYHDLLN